MTNTEDTKTIIARPVLKIHEHPGGNATPVPEGTVFDEKGNLYLVSLYGEGEGSTMNRAGFAGGWLRLGSGFITNR